MAIENAIAQFGMNAGNNIQNTVGNALLRNEERSRYNDKKNMLLAQQEQAAREKAEEFERQHVKGGVTAILSAPPEQRGQVYQGWYQDAARRGIELTGVPTEYSDEVLYKLAGAAGVDMRQPGTNSPSTVQEWQYFNSLPPEDQKRFLSMKRADKTLNLGGQQVVLDSAGNISKSYDVTPKPEDDPDFKAKQAAAEEAARLGQQLAIKPKIQAAVKQAEEEGKARGETVTALTRAKAALPGLIEVSEKLKQLADIATYTTSGRLFDTAVKELGFGATKGATARATMISIVDNQVLPLLRETFGAAFTKAEGDSLRATLLDANASPEQKKATLDAFIQQKYRNIESQEREVGVTGAAQNDIESLVNKYAD